MQANFENGNHLDDLFAQFTETPQYLYNAYAFSTSSTGEVADHGCEKDRINVENPFTSISYQEFLDGLEYHNSPNTQPANNFSAEEAAAGARGNVAMSMPIEDQIPAYPKGIGSAIECLGTGRHQPFQSFLPSWGSNESTLTYNPLEGLQDAIASDPSIESSPVTPASKMASDSDDRRSDLTSQEVKQLLSFIRTDQQHQPAITHFQDDSAAKLWRKRGQSQTVQNIQDTSFPRTPAEEREYVVLLKTAFKYLEAGASCSHQEYLFMMRQRDEDGEKAIESWCWQVLKQIIRRQTLGRPTDLHKRRTASLDPVSLTFAERFSVVHNALKFEKRCCIRFSTMASWHKRLANNPLGEMEEYQKNDNLNWKRAEEKRLLTEALAHEKATGTPSKRALDDVQSDCTTESPSVASYSSGKTTSKKTLSFTRGKTGRKKISGLASPGSLMPTPEERFSQASPQDLPISRSFSDPASRRPSRLSEALNSSPMKRMKLDGGFSDVLRAPIGSRAVYDSGLTGSTPTSGMHYSPPEISFRHQLGLASGAHPGISPYDTSASYSAITVVPPKAGQHYPEAHRLQLAFEPSSMKDAPSTTEDSSIPSAQELAIDAQVRGKGFTEGQKSRAKQARMSIPEYINFARVMTGMNLVEFDAIRAASSRG